MENVKAVVFGGGGFLGSHAADALTSAGHIVTIFDKSVSPWRQENQNLIVGDICDRDLVLEVVRGADVVYNFAGVSDLNKARNQALETARMNILGNINILDACVNENVTRFIYASTVYVNSREGGFYKCSKQASEEYIREYHNIWGLGYTILRYGSLYGPRSDDTNGLHAIVKKALVENKISYQGHRDTMRQYIHVSDAAKSSVVALNKEFLNESVVLTGQELMRVEDLLKTLAEIMGFSDQDIHFDEKKYAGHYVRTPYTYKADTGKKYCPPFHVDLGQGLVELIEDIANRKL